VLQVTTSLISGCLSQHTQPIQLLTKVCNQSFVEISVAVSIVRIRPAQLVASGQHDALDAILCCPQRHLKWEKNLLILSLVKQVENAKQFWELISYLFMETYTILLNRSVKMCYVVNCIVYDFFPIWIDEYNILCVRGLKGPMHVGIFTNRPTVHLYSMMFSVLEKKKTHPNVTAVLKNRIDLGWVFLINSGSDLPLGCCGQK